MSETPRPMMCPNCGQGFGALDDDEPFPDYWVFCPVCGIRGPMRRTREESIIAWNELKH